MSTTQAETVYTVRIRYEPGDEYSLWAEVEELPGCFASGRSMDELYEALSEAVSHYLSEPDHEVSVRLVPVEVTEQRMRAQRAA